tara:strand:- start:30 stop:719 length:690 start_codon:yes stop_codon:yes gene_type:complete
MTQKLSILFDLDGTLVDTAPDLMRAHNHVMQKFGYDTKGVEDIRNLVGKGASVLIGRSLWGSAKKEFSKIKNENEKKLMVKEFIDFYSKNIVNESRLIKGVIDFLKWAKLKKITMAVCTNKQENLAIDLLKKIKIYDFFDYVSGGNTFDYCKPDPRHLTSTIEIIGGELNKTIMIGDSENDADAAKSAGLPMILIEDGYTDKKVDQIHHDYLIKDYIGIEKIISKYIND